VSLNPDDTAATDGHAGVPLCTMNPPEPKVFDEKLTLEPNSAGLVKQIPMFVIPSASGPEIEICISFDACAALGSQTNVSESKTNFIKKLDAD
jgi:hypothetical protein